MPAPAAAARPLAGKVALVTGSTQGIGLGILRALAGAGAGVCCVVLCASDGAIAQPPSKASASPFRQPAAAC